MQPLVGELALLVLLSNRRRDGRFKHKSASPRFTGKIDASLKVFSKKTPPARGRSEEGQRPQPEIRRSPIPIITVSSQKYQAPCAPAIRGLGLGTLRLRVAIRAMPAIGLGCAHRRLRLCEWKAPPINPWLTPFGGVDCLTVA